MRGDEGRQTSYSESLLELEHSKLAVASDDYYAAEMRLRVRYVLDKKSRFSIQKLESVVSF